MQEQNMVVNVKGIKCDNPACDYQDMTVKYEEYPKWVNKPCPICGHNLLTEADYIQLQTFMELTAYINTLDLPKDDQIVKGKIEMNGTGQMMYHVEEVIDNK